MNKCLINDSTLTAIGNAIRKKNNTTELIIPSKMSEAIDNLILGGTFPDGSTWVKSNAPTAYWKCFDTDGAIIVTGPSGGGQSGLWYSTNAKVWKKTNITSNYFYDIHYDKHLWVAGSNAGLYYSTNGTTWTKSNITTGSFYNIYYANNIWIAVSYSAGVYYSEDGKTWTISNITTGSFNSVYYGDNKWVACSSASIYYSEDGKAWTQGNVNTYFKYVYYANHIWVATTSASGFYYSEDGETWIQSNITTGGSQCIYYANNLWVIASDTTNGLYWSNDGKTWTQSNITNVKFSSHHKHLLTYNNGIWIAGATTTAYYSIDGKVWTKSNYADWSNEIFYFNNKWIIGGDTGIWYTPIGGEGTYAWKVSKSESVSTTGTLTLNTTYYLFDGICMWMPGTCSFSDYTPKASDFYDMQIRVYYAGTSRYYKLASNGTVGYGTSSGSYTYPSGLTWDLGSTEAGSFTIAIRNSTGGYLHGTMGGGDWSAYGSVSITQQQTSLKGLYYIVSDNSATYPNNAYHTDNLYYAKI